MATSIVLADEHPVVRQGLRSWLTGASYEVLGEAADGAAAEMLTHDLRPNVLLSAVRMKPRDGLECLRRLRDAGDATPVLFLTAYENPTYSARARALGAAGLLPKSIGRDQLVEAVGRIDGGQDCWSAVVTKRYAGSVVADGQADAVTGLQLTVREGEVLKQLAFGLSNKEIASALGISYETVKEHVQHILRKLGVADRTQAAVWAVRQGLA